MADIKSGWKTSEFWLTLAAVLLGAFVNSGLVTEQHWSIKLAGVALAALTALGYTFKRTDLKSGLKILLPLALLVSVSACSSTLGNLHKAQVAISAADKIAVEVIGKKCLAEATTCGKSTAANCPGYKKCADARSIYQKSMKALDGELKIIYGLLFDLGVK